MPLIVVIRQTNSIPSAFPTNLAFTYGAYPCKPRRITGNLVDTEIYTFAVGDSIDILAPEARVVFHWFSGGLHIGRLLFAD